MASEIRVDKITSLSGVGTITPSPTGIDISGITTVATLKATTGIVTTLTATTGIVTTLTANTTTHLDDVTFTGASANITFDKSADDLIFGDNAQAKFGTGGDLSIFHNGAHSFIQETGTGALQIRGTNLILDNADGSKRYIDCNDGGTVQLYHNGIEKFSTQSYGIVVDGVVSFTKDAADDTTSTVQVNGAAMDASDYLYIMSAANNSINGLTMFLNGSTRGSDGGNNGLTIRNDDGPMNVGLNGTTHSNFFYTGAAGGVDFSGTSDGPSMGSELFDDYEEGSYTPVVTYGGTTYTYGASNDYTLRSPHSTANNNSISYVKIGSMVFLNFAIFWNQSYTIRYIISLPFTARGSAYALCTTPATFQVDIDGDVLGTLGTGNNSTGFDTYRILKDTGTGGHGNVPLSASSEVYYMISYEAQ